MSTPAPTTLAPTTEALYAQRLIERRDQADFDPHDIRLSELGSCLRKASLRILDFDSEQTTLEQESIFLSGDEHEDHIARIWQDLYPRQVMRQVKVPHPFGRSPGHIDIWVAPLKHIVESKSTTKKNLHRLPFDSHRDQVLLYLHFWGNARGATAEIAYRIKETGEVKSIPVVYDEARVKELLGYGQGLLHSVSLGEPMPIPEGYAPQAFPCSWRSEGEVKTCPFFRHCWEGTAERDAVFIPSMGAAVASLFEVESEASVAGRHKKAAEQERNDRRKVVAAIMQTHGTNTIRTETHRAWRTWVPTKGDPDVDAMVAAGILTNEQVAKYTPEAGGYWRWTVKPIAGREAAS